MKEIVEYYFKNQDTVLADTLHLLNPKEKKVMLLRYQFDWTASEVAENLRMSKASVSTYTGTAINKIRRHLKNEKRKCHRPV